MSVWAELRARYHEWTGGQLRASQEVRATGVLSEVAGRARMAPQELLTALGANLRPDLRRQLVGLLTVQTTWFLREAVGLRALVEQLARLSEARVREIEVWSAGCSTGQEAYTLALLMIEAGLRPRVLGTDISASALEVARRGVYAQAAVNMVPPGLRERYFDVGQGESRVREVLRGCVRFEEHNICTPPAVRATDAVVCRNVLVHFERQDAVRVLKAMALAGRARGWLLLGAVEQPLGWMTDLFAPAEESPILLARKTLPGASGSHPALQGPRARPATLPPGVITGQHAAVRTPGASAGASASANLAPLRRGFELLETGDRAGALAAADAVLKSDRVDGAAHLLRGLVLKGRGDAAGAVQELRCARFLMADEAWLPPYQLGLCLEQLGQPLEAFESFRHALEVLEANQGSGLPAGADADAAALADTVHRSLRTRFGRVADR